MIRVVAALIIKQGKILLAQRSTGDPSAIGKWEYPGGKVNLNENDKQAIEREIKEELDINIKAETLITKVVHEYSSKTIDLSIYLCKYVDGKINLHDHSQICWVDLNNILDYDLSAADVEITNKILKENLINKVI